MNIQLQKVHGSENDFFLLDETLMTQSMTEKQRAILAVKICNRKTGLLNGADGLLCITKPIDKCILGRMRVINADGSEASMCGNGLRTVARYLAEKYHQTNFVVRTMYADLKVQVADNLAIGVSTYKVEISPVSFEPKAVGMTFNHGSNLINQLVPEFDTQLKFSAVAVPNPHLIAFVNHENLTSSLLGDIATRLNEPNDFFPDGVNVTFAEILDTHELFTRTFERGVGFTNACGTAMSATSLLYVLLNQDQVQFNEQLTVRNPGGLVKTVVHEIDQDYFIELIGNATVLAQVSINFDLALHGDFDNAKIEPTREQDAYLNFIKANAS